MNFSERRIVTDEHVKRRQFLTGEFVSGIIEAELPLLASYIDRNDSLILVNHEGAVWFANQLFSRVSQLLGVDRSGQARDVKVRSATGQALHGEPHVEQWLAHPEEIERKHVFIPEDINDRGETLRAIIDKLLPLSPASITTAVLFEKDDVVGKVYRPDIILAHVPNRYWIGSGLDDGTGYGRDLPGLWEVILPK